jgi:hypothetical protein
MKNTIAQSPFWSALVLLIVLGSGCSRAYVSPQFSNQMSKAQTVAILPFEVIYTGRPPTGRTMEQLAAIDRDERLAFQNGLYRWVGHRWNRRPINIQSIAVTNAKLLQADIDIYNREKYNPQELADILGVDAVFVASVIKHRYRSDDASMAIDIGSSILVETGVLPGRPISSKTNDIRLSVSLVSRQDGSSLWRHSREGVANWNFPPAQSIDRVSRRTIRRLPKKI